MAGCQRGEPTDTIKLLILLKAVHLLAVMALVGGTFFNYTLVRPAQKALPPAQAAVMATRVGRWFTWLVWAALPTILITGFLRLALMRRWDQLFILEFYTQRYGRWLLVVILLWLVMVVVASAITLFLNPALTRKLPPSARTASGLGFLKLWDPLLYAHEREQPLWLTLVAWGTWLVWGAAALVLATSWLHLLAGGTPGEGWFAVMGGTWLAATAGILAVKFILVPLSTRRLPVTPEPGPADVTRRQEIQRSYSHRLEQLVLAGLVAGILASVAASSLALGGWF